MGYRWIENLAINWEDEPLTKDFIPMFCILFYNYYIFKTVSLLWGFRTSINASIVSICSEKNIAEFYEVLIQENHHSSKLRTRKSQKRQMMLMVSCLIVTSKDLKILIIILLYANQKLLMHQYYLYYLWCCIWYRLFINWL